jgi:hypothetical protein
MTSTGTTVRKLDRAASELAGERTLRQIFLTSLVPFETAARMRKHFRIGHHSWTLIPPG